MTLIVVFLGRLIRTALLVEFRKYLSLEPLSAQHGYLVHFIGIFLTADTTVCGRKSSSFCLPWSIGFLPCLFIQFPKINIIPLEHKPYVLYEVSLIG